jgi:hypothetical protein
MGQLTLSMGSAEVEVQEHFFGQRAIIPSKRVFSTFVNTTHANNIIHVPAMFYVKKYILFSAGKK